MTLMSEGDIGLPLFTRQCSAPMQTAYGLFELVYYENPMSWDLDDSRLPEYHEALVAGDVRGKQNVLVRIHSRCMSSEVFHDSSCDCSEQLQMSMERVQAEGACVIVYLMQEGKGIGLENKVRAAALAHREGLDMYDAFIRLGFPPDARTYCAAVDILKDLGVKPPIQLLTNNPDKIGQMAAYGIDAVRVPLIVPPTAHNLPSLLYRQHKLGHLLGL